MSRVKALRAKIGITMGATLLAGLGLGATATPAHAAWSDCPPGALCAYLYTSGGGTPGKVYGNNSNLRIYDKFARAKSVFNNGTQCHVTIWPGTNQGGNGSYRLQRGSRLIDTRAPEAVGGLFRNGIGSNRWC
ncbi:peptidase inhibitor family I36 protein [Streptomyces sp. ACA25]|uniref:peptidase inhibitor family I36 protein n=1 Tax=Streptomyces sp. ACA25 TaxID=3022596 RepID=UPI002307D008|nr:peptidase inhibitor family I36 protein [Streptomyces sp. ACA25]MDB1087270.1 peptidase inhibitor family I36 protein [Streptomyces sp. ACA25]